MYKICLVEDEQNLNNLIKSYLERAGYEVYQYYSGEEAIKIESNVIPSSKGCI